MKDRCRSASSSTFGAGGAGATMGIVAFVVAWNSEMPLKVWRYGLVGLFVCGVMLGFALGRYDQPDETNQEAP